MVSSRPSCMARPSTMIGWPPNCEMPTSKDSRVRVEFFSKMAATDLPASGWCPSGSALNVSARSRTSTCSAGLRSSSRRKCRAWFRTPSRWGWTRPGSWAGGDEVVRVASDRTSGGASRMESGCTALTRNPPSCAALATPAETGSVRATASSRPAPRTPATSGWCSCSTRAAMSLPSAAACSSRPSAAMVRARPARRRRTTGLPPKVVPCWPGLNRSAAAPMPMQAPIGRPPPRPLARVTTSGTMPVCWCGNQVPVRPMPVCTSSSTSSAPAPARDLPRGLQETVGRGRSRRPRPGSARRTRRRCHRRQRTPARPRRRTGRARRRAAAARTASAWPAVPVSDSAPMVRPWNAPSKATILRAAGAPGQLERGLVGLGAGVGEEHPGRLADQVDQLLGQLERRLVDEQVRGVAERADLLGDGRTTAGWAWPRALTAIPAKRSR